MGNDKVRITADLADLVKSITLPPAAQKLFLALVYLQDQTDHRWTRQSWEDRVKVRFFCGLGDLRALGCAPKARNTRFFRTAVAALEQRPDLFGKIELCTASGHLRWSFSAEVWQAMSEMEPYGLMRIGDIARITGGPDLVLLTQIVVQRRKHMPDFVLTGRDLGLDSPDADDPDLFDLRAMRRRLEPALRRWAGYIGSPVHLGYEQRGHMPGYVRARIRFKGQPNHWKAAAIQRFPLNTKVFEIIP
ncbi:hypothetical protein O4G76_14875 [Limimaricola sp. G21655-S1]|uniref:hypothetical protein n=1 Tax=Limimaricola sp. G21655-S1 TaxID=3014768 RepID=UPI0022AE92B0|nr:hypothetical protein [Limimaricola sp. G21655-S1]MCZ4262127.1 hypothetical protein [Limimaricola sp. G21655-S1]